MIFIWGKKYVYRQLGYVADFCPICRGPQPFLVRRVGLAGHIYYITAGEGELVGHERTCKGCDTALNADPAIYASFFKERQPLAQLLARTYPNFSTALQDRLALEERVRNTPALLSPQERARLIQLPFALLSPKVESRLAKVSFDLRSGLTLLGIAFLTPVALRLVQAALPASMPEENGVIAVLLIAAAVFFWQMAGVGRRFVRRRIVPTLATTLRPLKPTDRELQAVLADLKKHKHKLGSKLKLTDLTTVMRAKAQPQASANSITTS